MRREQLQTPASPVALTEEQSGQVAGGSALNTFVFPTRPPEIEKITGAASDDNGQTHNDHTKVVNVKTI